LNIDKIFLFIVILLFYFYLKLKLIHANFMHKVLILYLLRNMDFRIDSSLTHKNIFSLFMKILILELILFFYLKNHFIYESNYCM